MFKASGLFVGNDRFVGVRSMRSEIHSIVGHQASETTGLHSWVWVSIARRAKFSIYGGSGRRSTYVFRAKAHAAVTG